MLPALSNRYTLFPCFRFKDNPKRHGVGSLSSKDVVIWVQIIWVQIIYLVDDFVISFLFYLIWVQKINLVDITNYDYECHLLCSLFFFSFCMGEEG